MGQVYVRKNGKWLNLTRFRNPHNIYDFSVSRDGRRALVHHMDFSPTRISVYDLETLKALHTWKPGAGGTWTWSKTGRIVLVNGCGTGCAQITVFRIDGGIIYQGPDNEYSESARIAINPSGEYAVFLPQMESMPDRPEIVRLDDGKIWTVKTEKLVAFDYEWLSSGTISITLLVPMDYPEDYYGGDIPVRINVSKYVKKHNPDRIYSGHAR
ncbi:MAG: hypothetical protein HZB23_06865 [Deltaproteobacteria bacterium]|nr:hypothetical protein [Deltaproteobacteria bacterium]